jgi:hypothetical protein
MNFNRPFSTAAGILLAVLATAAHANYWVYDTANDPMTDKPSSFAQLTSMNSLALAFPYRGANYGDLHVRRTPRGGVDVLFTIGQGQIMCHGFDDNCALLIRFDASEPRRFRAVGTSDHDPKVVFLRDAAGFITSATKAKRILVQVEVFQNGVQTLEFRPDTPLKWDTAKPRSPSPSSRKHSAAVPTDTALCPQSTNFSSTGECGRLYAECALAAKDFTADVGRHFIDVCRKNGVEAAWIDWRAGRSAAEADGRAPVYPAPPANFFINQK